MGALTEDIVEFVATASGRDLPDRAIEVARDGFTDAIGVMVAGMAEPVYEVVLGTLRAQAATGESRLALTTEVGTPSDAALLGATTAHALDYDDYAFSNHVSAVMVPAIIAAADETGVSGARMVQAYVTGYEVWRTIMKRELDHLHSKGWHPTGTFGALGTAAAVAVVYGLDAEVARNALGLAVANSGGVMANFGTMAKPYQGGRVAQAGVASVELAMAGMTGGPHAIDDPRGGLLVALSPAGRVDVTSGAPHLGHEWKIAEEGIHIKLHPTVGASQRGIDCAVQLHRDHFVPAELSASHVDVERITRIVPKVSEKHYAVMQFPRPTNALEAKFSLEFGVVAGLIRGVVGLDELTDDFVTRPDVQRLIELVDVQVGPDDDPEYPVGAAADVVEVHLDDGTVLVSEPVRRFRGHGQNPMSLDELRGKFMTCAGRRIAPQRAEALFAALRRIDELDSSVDIPSIDG